MIQRVDSTTNTLAAHHAKDKKRASDREGQAKVTVQVDTLGAPQVWAEGYTGKGVGIAVIDSGAVPHPDFRDRLVAFKDFVNATGQPSEDADPSLAYDDNGHGTSCATVSTGNGAAGKAAGTAPGANLIALKAIGSDGMAWSSNVVKAIQWAVDNKERYNIRVINMSFFLDDPNVAAHQPVMQALEVAAKAGIIPVAAASNDGPSSKTLHTIASYPHVVTVAASNTRDTVSQNDDSIANFSSRGPGDNGEMKPDVAAPGQDVVVGTRRGGYARSSGTSFASPIAAGVIATWIEANPKLNVTDVQGIIAETSHPIALYNHYDQGHGQIDALAGLHKALAMKEQPATA